MCFLVVMYRFTSATVHKRWTVQQLQDALTAVEEVQSMGDADADVTEVLPILCLSFLLSLCRGAGKTMPSLVEPLLGGKYSYEY